MARGGCEPAGVAVGEHLKQQHYMLARGRRASRSGTVDRLSSSRMASAADSTAEFRDVRHCRSTAHEVDGGRPRGRSVRASFHRSHVHSPGADVPSGGERDDQRAGYPDRGCSPNSQRGDGLDDLVNRRQPHDDAMAGN